MAGTWHGWSVYLPVDGFFFEDREAIYRINATIEQHGRRLAMYEQLIRIYDIDGRLLDNTPVRKFTCKGRLTNSMNAILTFGSADGAISGTIYAALDPAGDEIYGILAVRPRRTGRPVALKMLLRRAEAEMPTLEDLGIDRIRRMSTPDNQP
jgi:hypothetical protein